MVVLWTAPAGAAQRDGASTGWPGAPRVDQTRFDRVPLRAFDGSLRFSAVTHATLEVHADGLDLLDTLVDGRRVTWSEDGAAWRAQNSYLEGGPYAYPVISAYDLAGRFASNAMQVEGLPRFWVDLTAPQVQLASLEADHMEWYPPASDVSEEGGIVAVGSEGTDAPRLRLHVTDAQGLSEAELVDEDGLTLAALPLQQGATDSELTYELPAEGLTREMSLRLRDLAGNERVWNMGPRGEVLDVRGSDVACTPVCWTDGDGVVRTVHPSSVVVDREAPQARLLLPEGWADGWRSNEPVQVGVRVSDDRLRELAALCPERQVLSVQRVDPWGNESVESVSLGSMQEQKDRRMEGGYVASGDGSYVVRSSLQDLAGRESDEEQAAFEVDRTSPALSVTFALADGQPVGPKTGVSSSAGAMSFAVPVVAQVAVDEQHFDPSLVQLYTTGQVGEWSEQGTRHVLEVRLGPGMHDLRVHAADSFGNQAVPLQLDGIVVDSEAPSFADVGMAGAQTRLVGRDLLLVRSAGARLTVDVRDKVALGRVSLVGAGDGVTLDSKSSGDAGRRQWEVFLPDGARLGDGASLCATDAVGNRSSEMLWRLLLRAAGMSTDQANSPTVMVDGTPPALSLDGPRGIVGSPQTVRLRVSESSMELLRSLDSQQEVLSIRRLSGAGSADDATAELDGSEREVVRVRDLVPDGTGWLAMCTLREDGCYGVAARLEDLAGNVGVASLPDFVVDGTPPRVFTTYPDGEPRGTCRGPVRVDVHVVEKNFDESLVSLDTDGNPGTWSGSGDEHVLRVTFGGDGEHHLCVRASDRAGNASEAFKMREFQTDGTPPSIVVGGVEDQHAYAGPVEGWVRLSDAYGLDPDSPQVSLARGSGETVELPVRWEGGVAIAELPQLPCDREHDDVYTLVARAADVAGNTSQSQTRFSLNRHGSTFEVLDGDLMRGMPHLRSARDVSVREINVCGAEPGRRTVRLTEGLRTRELERSAVAREGCYVLEDAKDQRGWSVATYRIPRENFRQDGTYRVAVGSYDRAGNANLSVSGQDGAMGLEVAFVLDTTLPKLRCSGVSDGEVVRGDSATVDIEVADEEGVQSVRATLDGEEASLETVAPGHLRMAVPAKEAKDRELVVVATDEAGNEATCKVSGFRVQRRGGGLVSAILDGGDAARGGDAQKRTMPSWLGWVAAGAAGTLLVALATAKRRLGRGHMG
ncbi:MAG: Ig-like domain-containing protein [Atopobiaceae bacterium]